MELIRQIFSTSNKHRIWLNVEALIIKFFYLKGYISQTLSEKIIVNLRVPKFELFGNVKTEEGEWGNFIKMLYSEMKFLDKELMDFALSKDNFADIANILILKEAGEELKKKIVEIKEELKKLAIKYKELPQIGRTHGMHAEPTAFGHKFIVYYADIGRELDELSKALEQTNCLCVNYNLLFNSALAVELQDFLSKYLNIPLKGVSKNCPKHKYQRFFTSLNLIAQTIGRIITDLRLLQNVGEVRIKDNKVEALAKVIQGYSNIDLFEYERSEKERDILFEVVNSSYLLLVDAIGVLRELEINEEIIKENIQLTKGTVFSNTVMCHLINNTDDSRIEVLRNLKEISSGTLNNDYPSFKEGLLWSKYFEYVNDKLFEIDYHLRFMDELYEKVFGNIRDEKNIDLFVQDLAQKLNEFYDFKEPILIVAFFERTLSFLTKLLSKLKFPVMLINIDYQESLHPLVVDRFKNQRVLILDHFVDEKSLLPKLINNLKRAFAKEVKVCALYKCNEFKDQNLVEWFGTLSSDGNYS